MITKSLNYIARQGDTLFSVARMFNTAIDDLTNGNNIINPSLIYPGMPLTVSVKGIMYTAAPDENVYGIAMRFGVPYEAIILANSLAYPYIIYPGTSLFIPGIRGNGSAQTAGCPDASMPDWGYPSPPCGSYPWPTPPPCGYPYPPQPDPCPPQPCPCPPMPEPMPCPPQPEPIPCPPMPQPMPCPPQPQPADYFIYTVKSCDTLYKLSMLFCTSIEAIACANNIANPNLIYIGQKLRIPVTCGKLMHYTVAAGDSLYKIAGMFNTTVNSIAKANGIADPALICPGQQLVIIADCKPDP